MSLSEFEVQLRSLISGEHSSITLTFNDQSGPNYCTVREYCESDYHEVHGTWISEEEKQRAIETNSMWTLQLWYPSPPIGFYVYNASSLAALVEFVMRKQSEGAFR